MKSIINITKVLIISSVLFPLISNAEVPEQISSLFKHELVSNFDIKIKVPEIAEEGSKVLVEIQDITNIPDGSYIQELTLYNDFREDPVTNIKPGKRMIINGLTFQVKMKDSGNVYAVAKLSNGAILTGKKLIKVTNGGCGG